MITEKKSQITDISTFCYWLHQKWVGIYEYIEIDNVVLVFRSLGYIFLIVQNRDLANSKVKAMTQNGIMLSWMTVTNSLGVAKKWNTLNISSKLERQTQSMKIKICQYFKYKEWKPNEQYFSYIMAITSCMWWSDNDVGFVLVLLT
jgi:hypothetical protein